MDLTSNLKFLEFESGLADSESELEFLRSRSSALAVCGCAHAVFLCTLASMTRKKLKDVSSQSHVRGLHVGILAGGCIGKQLAQLLLSVPDFKPSDINISTKRPDMLRELSTSGVECYFNNHRLAIWADLLFLCILPSHLPLVCAELYNQLPKHCLVYSFTSAVPLQRLALLLGHTLIFKPHYGFVCHDSVQMWLHHNQVDAALKDKEVLSASCPLTMSGGLSLDQRWVSAALYTLINICTAEGLSSNQTIQLLNDLFQSKISTLHFTYQSVVNSSCAAKLNSSDEPFPWMNLIDAQTKQTPFSLCLSGCKALQESISAMYYQIFSNLSERKLK